MTKKELKELALEAFNNFMANSEGINLDTAKFMGAGMEEDWGTYHEAHIGWYCPEMTEFIDSKGNNLDWGDYGEFLEEHGLDYTEEVDCGNYTIKFYL